MDTPIQNRLLAAYIREAGPELLSRLEPVATPFKYQLFGTEQRPRYVHFPCSGVASLVALLSEGAEVEVSMTGHEGLPEAVYLLGPKTSLRDCLMQVKGKALRMPFREFEQIFQEDAVMRRLVLRYVQYQSMMSTQLVACNGQHDAEARLARWLLMVQDRVESPDLPLTQEFLGQMLGSRRSTVTVAASHLQQAGMIDYRRGQVRIMDRTRLIDTACECYQVIQRMFDSLYQD